jgi:hypothetical protein
MPFATISPPECNYNQLADDIRLVEYDAFALIIRYKVSEVRLVRNNTDAVSGDWRPLLELSVTNLAKKSEVSAVPDTTRTEAVASA